MSLLRKINIALVIVVGLFILKPLFYSVDYIKPLMKSYPLNYTLKNNVISFETLNDEDVYECLYKIYPHVESFVIRKNKKNITGQFVLKKRFCLRKFS